MSVVVPSRNDMPMNVGTNVAEGGEIDLRRLRDTPQHALDLENDAHDADPIRVFKVGQLSHMIHGDDSIEDRMIVVIHANHPAQVVAPQLPFCGVATDFAFGQDVIPLFFRTS